MRARNRRGYRGQSAFLEVPLNDFYVLIKLILRDNQIHAISPYRIV